MDDVALTSLTYVLLLRLARQPLPHQHLARLWHVPLQELEDLHLVTRKQGLLFSFSDHWTVYVLSLVSLKLQVLTGPDESDLALSEVRSIVSSERVLPFSAADLSHHAQLLTDVWTDYHVACGFLLPHLQASFFTLFGRLHRRQTRNVMVGLDEDGILPAEGDAMEPSPENVGTADLAHERSPSETSDVLFSFPNSDDSQPAWRDKVSEIWQEQDEMVQTLCEGSEVVQQNDVYFPLASDSPETRLSKLKQIWQDEDDYVQSLMGNSSVDPVPEQSSSSTGDIHFPTSSDSSEVRLRKLQELWKEDDDWVKDLLLSPAHDDDPIEQFEEEPRSASKMPRKERLEINYKAFLQTCFLVGVKIPRDSGLHLVEDTGFKKVSQWMQDIRLACATTEYCQSLDMCFEDGILEFDTASVSVDRKPSAADAMLSRRKEERKGKHWAQKKGVKPVQKRYLKKSASKTQSVHRGRFLVFTLRSGTTPISRRSFALIPLPPKTGNKCKAPGPESFEETVHHIAQKLDPKRHIAAADGSPSLQKAASALGAASAPGVAHWKNLFTPLSTIPKRNLDEDTKKLLQRSAKKTKNPVVREHRNSFLMTGGDNVAESLVRVGKHQLRRLGQLGGAKDSLEHRNILSAFYIHRNPGLQSVLHALRCHREKVNGALSPAKTFNTALWTS
eukprot:s2739_g3.t1